MSCLILSIFEQKPVHRDESIDPLVCMKPKGRSHMREVERSWGCYSGQETGLAKVQCQIQENKEMCIPFYTFDAGLVLVRLEHALPGQQNQISPGL